MNSNDIRMYNYAEGYTRRKVKIKYEKRSWKYMQVHQYIREEHFPYMQIHGVVN